MSKIKVQSPSSGTAVFTLTTASGTSTDRTITLPDEDITLGGGVDGIVSTANATAITIDSSENVGIGVVPETWHSGYRGFQIDALSLMAHKTSSTVHTMGNAYHNGSVYKYLRSDTANQYSMEGGDQVFRVAISGTADGTITWTDQLSLKSDGRGLSQFTAKAWCKWNANTTSSNVTYGHNVSSVSYVSGGHWRVNYTNNLTSNYSAQITCMDNGGRHTTFRVGEFLTSYCGVFITNTSQNGTTSDVACFTAFGE